MINTAPLYNVRTDRYKGVYAGPGKDQWDAIVQTPEGKLKRLKRFTNPEEAARAVATYYLEVLGENWGELIQSAKRMARDWKIKRIERYLYMAAQHRGPKTTVYEARVKLDPKTWHSIQPLDITPDPTTVSAWWDEKAEGWVSIAAALVVIRMYRALRSQPSRTGG